MEAKKIRNPYLLLAAITCSVIVFIVYYFMLSNVYSTANFGSDGGDLLSAILTDGIPHPTGYPAYLLVGKLFQFWPNPSPFFRASLVSAFFSAVSVGLVAYFLGSFLLDKQNIFSNAVYPIVVGLSLGFSPLLWSQAVIVEVYGLTLFFFVCILYWIALVMKGSNEKTIITLILFLSFVIGFGFGTHLLLILMIPAIFYAAYISIKKGSRPKFIIQYFLIMFLGIALVYSFLPIRARSYPPINWGNPQTLSGFFWLVTGNAYQDLAFQIPTKDIFPRIQFFAKMTLEQFLIPGLIMGLFGLTSSNESYKEFKPLLIWVLIIYPIFSIGYLTNDSIVYLIPFYVIFSLFIGIGLSSIRFKNKIANTLFECLLTIAILVPLIIRVPELKQQIDPRKNNFAKTSVEECLKTLPNDTFLITSSDLDTFSIWYYHFGLGIRKDILVVVDSLVQYPWYLQTLMHTYPDLKYPNVSFSSSLESLIKENPKRTVCYTEIMDATSGSFTCHCKTDK